MVLYLTYWIPARERARAGALFMTAAPVTMVIGAPVSEALLKLDGRLGLHGWQWLFLVEGFPAVVLGLVALRYLTDRPEKADWLAPEDREWLSAEMARERAQRARPRARLVPPRPAQRQGGAALRDLLLQHARHLRRVPVAAQDPAGRPRASAASS